MNFSDQELRYLARSIDFQQAVWMNTPAGRLWLKARKINRQLFKMKA
jgi:hypothetical protein